MMKDLAHLGEYYIQRRWGNEEFVPDPVEGRFIIRIDFNSDGTYNKTDYEELKEDYENKYFFLRAKSNRLPTLSLTINGQLNKSKVSIEEVVKKHKHLHSSLDGIIKSIPTSNDPAEAKKIENYKAVLQKIQEQLKSGKVIEATARELSRIAERNVDGGSKSKKSKEDILYYISITINGQYICDTTANDNKELAKLVLEAVKEKYTKEGCDAKGEGICFICEEKKEVSGNLSPYAFYSIDQPGYITNGHSEKNAYRNFPVCYQCRTKLRHGRFYVEKYLSDKIGPFEYHVIPKFIFSQELLRKITGRNEFYKGLEIQKSPIETLSKEPLSLFKKSDMLFHFIAKQSSEKNIDFLLVDILFIEKEQRQESIALHIEDVYPSRITELLEAKTKVLNSIPFVKKAYSSKNNKHYLSDDFTYSTIRDIITLSFNNQDEQTKKIFLSIVDATFKGEKIDETFLHGILLNAIRNAKNNNEKSFLIETTIIDAYRTLAFIKFTTGEVTMLNYNFEPRTVKNVEEAKKAIDEYLDSLPNITENYEKTLILLGLLLARIGNQQLGKGLNRPIMKKTNDLKMRYKDLEGLISTVKQKMIEYDMNRIIDQALWELFSRYLACTPEIRNISYKTLNLFTVIGTGLERDLRALIQVEKKKKDEDENSNEGQSDKEAT